MQLAQANLKAGDRFRYAGFKQLYVVKRLVERGAIVTMAWIYEADPNETGHERLAENTVDIEPIGC